MLRWPWRNRKRTSDMDGRGRVRPNGDFVSGDPKGEPDTQESPPAPASGVKSSIVASEGRGSEFDAPPGVVPEAYTPSATATSGPPGRSASSLPARPLTSMNRKRPTPPSRTSPSRTVRGVSSETAVAAAISGGSEGARPPASPSGGHAECGHGGAWRLPGLSRVQQARHRRVREPSAAAANAVADHPRERSGEPVQRASRSVASGGMEASDAGPSMYPRSRSAD